MDRAVPRAQITAEDIATAARYSSTSDLRGEYHLIGLPPGRYTLSATSDGFRPYRNSAVVVRFEDKLRIDLRLELGLASNSIDVSAAAPLLQTATGEVAFHLDQRPIETLPLDGRNFIPLVTLAPGVALPNGQFLPRINGSRPRTSEYIYDGISM